MNRIYFFGFFAVYLLFGFAAYAQSPQSLSAMQNWQVGRNIEGRDGLDAANPFYDEAIRLCQLEIDNNVATRDTYTIITWALRRQNRHSEVIALGQRGLASFPDEFRIMQTMGESWFFLGNFNNSLHYMQMYTHALPLGERSSVAFFFVGEIHRLTQRFHHADIAYTAAVALAPNLPLWWYRLATVRAAVGDMDEAIAAFEQVLRLNPNHQSAIQRLAQLRVQ
ncbi:MAG: tetratricopeptide repeat protein [Spirochaetes bacterium]|nr:tetratricopeptide repeat protein [Spirochaetota bacterium]